MTNGLHGILHSFHVNKGIVFHDVTLHHSAVLFKFGPQLLVGAGNVADVQLGGASRLAPAQLDIHRLTVELVLVEVANGFLRLGFVVHVDETKILYNSTFCNLSVLRKERAQFVRRCVWGQVPDEDFHHFQGSRVTEGSEERSGIRTTIVDQKNKQKTLNSQAGLPS